MGLLSWIVIGVLAGWIAGMIMKVKTGGFIGNIIVGVIGAVIGGGVMNFIGKVGVTGFNIYSLFVAVLGAVILLWVIKMVTGRGD